MPPEDCGASYVYCLAHASQYHGQIADAFHPLIRHGIITPTEPDELSEFGNNVDAAVRQCNDYVQGVSSLNRNLEHRIEERTRELQQANRHLADQQRYIEDVSTKISRYLPQQLYQSIFSGSMGAQIGSRRKHLTVFFTDICNFTTRTEALEPEALSDILNTYFSAMTEIARSHGATIDKFIGDAILGFFGDPDTEGPARDAANCVAMAIEMQRRTSLLKSEFVRHGLTRPLEIRIGINSGHCTVGNFGSFERMDYTIVGTPVNVAARLQTACSPNAILVSATTCALCKDTHHFQPRGPLALKGISNPVETFEVEFENSPAGDSRATNDNPLDALRQKLSNIDIEDLSDDERKTLLSSIARLAKD